jgi:hypothetical protein
LRETVGSIEKDGGEDQQRQRKNIVVVTHGVFMKFLAEDETIELPKAGWKAFRVDGREDGGACCPKVNAQRRDCHLCRIGTIPDNLDADVPRVKVTDHMLGPNLEPGSSAAWLSIGGLALSPTCSKC